MTWITTRHAGGVARAPRPDRGTQERSRGLAPTGRRAPATVVARRRPPRHRAASCEARHRGPV